MHERLNGRSPALQSLVAAHGEMDKRKQKKALPLVTAMLHRVATASEFLDGSWLAAARSTGEQLLTAPRRAAALQQKHRLLLQLYRTFIRETQEFLWQPKKLEKDKWYDTQVALVMVAGSMATALNRLGSLGCPDGAEDVWDVHGNLVEWNIEVDTPRARPRRLAHRAQDRQWMFRWLVTFARDTAEVNQPATPPAAEPKDASQGVRTAGLALDWRTNSRAQPIASASLPARAASRCGRSPRSAASSTRKTWPIRSQLPPTTRHEG